jgi:hypothetical protein
VWERNIWVSIEEATVSSGRKVVNIVVGVLKNVQTPSEKSFFSVMPGNLCSESHKNGECCQ